MSILRFLNYPETSSNSLRMAAHYDDNPLTLLHQSVSENGFDSLQVMLPNETHWPSGPAQDLFFVNVGEALIYLTEGRVVATKHRVASVPKHLREGSARTSAVFFCAPNWDCGLRPVSPQGVDNELGQMAKGFGLNELRDPDGSIPYYRLQNRAVDRGFVS
ncbi:MAG: 2OG-Fe(II) oxygenase family protein [Myxococcota bacterium]|nr:2OG-Fe(II) oxygenase family protein [Myxococcota bacterium]